MLDGVSLLVIVTTDYTHSHRHAGMEGQINVDKCKCKQKKVVTAFQSQLMISQTNK